jgi:membrane dipeptidase
VLVDLHAHFPMHLLPDGGGATQRRIRALARNRWRARVVDLISRVANYQGPGDRPGVTEALMRAGDVGVVLSVLYQPFDEIDLSLRYGAPPQPGYFSDLLAQIDTVERHARARADRIGVAHSPGELRELVAGGRIALIHAVEGAFHIAGDPDAVAGRVRTLAERGVAYITVAHLFWRGVATNAPALPFLPDWLYRFAFPQPPQGLSELGRATVRAMVAHGVLVDITHMGPPALRDTFELLDTLDPGERVPVVATHMACRFGGLEYCLTDETIRRVARRGGVLGVILCEHYITRGLRGPRPRGFEDSVMRLCEHIDRIARVTGGFDHVAIGSDLDGYIKPALPGLEHMGRMRDLQDALSARYGDEDAKRICSANALRLLDRSWGRAPATP